jgi:hypothetical protein
LVRRRRILLATVTWESERKRISLAAVIEGSGRGDDHDPNDGVALWVAEALESGEAETDHVGSRLIG